MLLEVYTQISRFMKKGYAEHWHSFEICWKADYLATTLVILTEGRNL
jgi:hypothetical protein